MQRRGRKVANIKSCSFFLSISLPPWQPILTPIPTCSQCVKATAYSSCVVSSSRSDPAVSSTGLGSRWTAWVQWSRQLRSGLASTHGGAVEIECTSSSAVTHQNNTACAVPARGQHHREVNCNWAGSETEPETGRLRNPPWW